MDSPFSLTRSVQPATGVNETYFHWAQIAAAALMLYDLAISLSDEIFLIWRDREGERKYTYFWTRYGLLLFQGARKILELYQRNRSNESTCGLLATYEIISANIALNSTEYVLLQHVHLLWNRSRRTRILLRRCFWMSLALKCTATLSVIYKQLAGTSNCAFLDSVDWPIYFAFGVGAGLTQGVIIVSTLLWLVLCRRMRTPLTSLLLKDTLVVVGWVFVLSITVVLYGIIGAVYLRKEMSSAIRGAAYSWLLALLSILASGLLLNFRRMVVGRYGHRSEEDEFSDTGLHSHPQELSQLAIEEPFQTSTPGTFMDKPSY